MALFLFTYENLIRYYIFRGACLKEKDHCETAKNNWKDFNCKYNKISLRCTIFIISMALKMAEAERMIQYLVKNESG